MVNDSNKMALGCLALVSVFIVVIMLSILLVEGLTYLICMGFGFYWTWWLGLAVWAILAILYILAKIVM